MLKFYFAQHIYEKREGSGSVPRTNESGAGSGRPKNMRIPNTASKYGTANLQPLAFRTPLQGPDSDPAFDFAAGPAPGRIWIWLPKMMWIHADSDPQHCVGQLNISTKIILWIGMKIGYGFTFCRSVVPKCWTTILYLNMWKTEFISF